MYTIIEAAGFQYKVAAGTVVKLPTLAAQVGETVEFKTVLLASDSEGTSVGTPALEGSLVKAEVLAHGRHKKVKIFKMKRRQGYRLTKGHRQGYTEVVFTAIDAAGKSATLDESVVVKERARVAALAKAKVQIKNPTRAEKVAASAAK